MKFESDSEHVAHLAIKREYGYAQRVDDDRTYVGNNKMLISSIREEADLHVIANNEHFYFKEIFTANRY